MMKRDLSPVAPSHCNSMPQTHRRRHYLTIRYSLGWALIVALVSAAPVQASPVLVQTTLDAWKVYLDITERRIDGELRSATVPYHGEIASLKAGKIQIQQLATRRPDGKSIEIPEGSVHHWRGVVFIPDTNLNKVVPWLQDYSQYESYFKDVEDSNVRSRSGDEFDIFLRLKRTKAGVTARFNTKHRVVYNRRQAGFISSVSRSTEIREVKDAGDPEESEYPVGNDSGYIWRLNSYWRFTERDGGVVVECESIGLSRSLGWGLGMLNFLTLGYVRSVAESIAREALEDTLTDLRSGVRGGPKKSAR